MDREFYEDLKRSAAAAARGAQQGLTTDTLGAPVDLVNMALGALGVNIPAPVGGSEWFQRQAEERGLLPPAEDSLQYQAGRFLGPMAAAGVPRALEAAKNLGVNAVQEYLQAASGSNPYRGQLGAIAYHGTPHTFPPTEANPLGEFDLARMGSGEGNQSYGAGAYLAEEKRVAEGYARALAARKEMDPDWWKSKNLPEFLTPDEQREFNFLQAKLYKDAYGGPSFTQEDSLRWRGLKDKYDQYYEAVNSMKPVPTLYSVDVPDEAIAKMLDYDKPLSQQPPEVQAAIEGISAKLGVSPEEFGTGPLGPTVVRAAMEEQLAAAGIPGIRYLDANSRGMGEGTSNFVLFDPKLAKIVERNGKRAEELAARGGR